MEFYGYLGLCGRAPSLTSSFLAFPSQDLPGANVFSIFFRFIEASPCKTVLLPILQVPMRFYFIEAIPCKTVLFPIL